MVSLKHIISLLVFILFVHFFATIYSWYWTYFWLDMPMHFLGGFWVAMIYFWLCNQFQEVREEVEPRRIKTVIAIISCLSFVALIGVFWEFFEFLYDILISSRGYSGFLQLGAADMIGDLFFDFLGGSAFLIIYILYRSSRDLK